MRTGERTDAFEIIDGGSERRLVLTCEHASVRLPEPWTWPEADRWLVGSHWSVDRGAASLLRAFSLQLGCVGLLARFTRLLVDPNRPESDDTLFRRVADGRPVALNAAISPDEREERLERFYRPFHAAADQLVGSTPDAVVLSLHTFTSVYEGEARSIEVGVLFDRDERQAVHVQRWLARSGIDARLNEPYSGARGLMYSPDRVGRAFGRPAIELEVRQDLAIDAHFRRRLVSLLGEALAVLP